MHTKRPATEEEALKALQDHASHWNFCNPSFEIAMPQWQAKQDQALAEGYLNETCSCGCVYLAFHHFTRCNAEGCPFNCGKSVLQMLGE